MKRASAVKPSIPAIRARCAPVVGMSWRQTAGADRGDRGGLVPALLAHDRVDERLEVGALARHRTFYRFPKREWPGKTPRLLSVRRRRLGQRIPEAIDHQALSEMRVPRARKQVRKLHSVGEAHSLAIGRTPPEQPRHFLRRCAVEACLKQDAGSLDVGVAEHARTEHQGSRLRLHRWRARSSAPAVISERKVIHQRGVHGFERRPVHPPALRRARSSSGPVHALRCHLLPPRAAPARCVRRRSHPRGTRTRRGARRPAGPGSDRPIAARPRRSAPARGLFRPHHPEARPHTSRASAAQRGLAVAAEFLEFGHTARDVPCPRDRSTPVQCGLFVRSQRCEGLLRVRVAPKTK